MFTIPALGYFSELGKMVTASANVDQLEEAAHDMLMIPVLLLQWHAARTVPLGVYLVLCPLISRFQGSPTHVKLMSGRRTRPAPCRSG